MLRRYHAILALPAVLALGGCITTERPPQRTSTVIVTPPPARAPVAVMAPSAPPPPPPQAALVPPPPQGANDVVWQPGHWTYSGTQDAPWTWVSGRYVVPPDRKMATWMPGRWEETTRGSWIWNAGHWE